MKRFAANGFTLAELLLVAAIVAVIAAVAVPMLSPGEPQKLATAAGETASLLRFAVSEARRTGGYVLVDGLSSAGQLKLYNSNFEARVPPFAGTSETVDPLTKRAAVLDVSGSAFSRGVTLTPQFRAGGSYRPQLLIGPGLTQMQGFDGPGGGQGTLQPTSGVLLGYGGKSVKVAIHETTALVTLP